MIKLSETKVCRLLITAKMCRKLCSVARNCIVNFVDPMHKICENHESFLIKIKCFYVANPYTIKDGPPCQTYRGVRQPD